jgi:hypothetical protein
LSKSESLLILNFPERILLCVGDFSSILRLRPFPNFADGVADSLTGIELSPDPGIFGRPLQIKINFTYSHLN